MLAIRLAAEKLNRWRLNDCQIYVSLEPCIMCVGAIMNARINKLYFGAYDLKNGHSDLLKNTEVYGGFMEDECKKLLDSFFKEIRKDFQE